MEKTTVFQKRDCIILFSIIIASMVIGSCWDLDIAKAVYNEQNLFGIIFAGYGQYPVYLSLVIAGTIFLQTMDLKRVSSKVLNAVFGVLLIALGALAMGLDVSINIPLMPVMLNISIVLLFLVIAMVVTHRFLNTINSKHQRLFAYTLLIVCFGSLILVNTIKIPWGRPRMRMIEVTPTAYFTPWWVAGSSLKDTLLPLGIAAEEFKSFPSGHTASAACILMIALLPDMMPAMNMKSRTLLYLGFLFVVMIASSRMIMGAHFLTDTTIGFTVTLLIEIITVHGFYLRRRRTLHE